MTGGAGFIGSHMVVELAAAGYRPIIIDDFSNSEKTVIGRLEKLIGSRPIVYEGKFQDTKLLFKLLDKEKIDGVIHLATFERELRQHAPRLWNDYLNLRSTILPINRRRIYMDFISQPIDTALSEHVPDGLVVEGKFDWADVGSFHDLHDASDQDKTGNHISGENIELDNVTDSYVRNETETPVAVIGVNDVAVIATENGILVTNKAQAQKVGDISKRLQAQDEKKFKWLEKLQP